MNTMSRPIPQVAVVGAGLMGHAIAQACAQAGVRVRLTDVDRRALTAGCQKIGQNLRVMVANRLLSSRRAEAVRARITAVADVSEAVKGAGLVQETIPEELPLKKRLFAQLDRLCADRSVILATNTSSFRIAEIASATQTPERVVGIHWMSPAYLVPVIEVVRGKATSENTVTRVTRYVRDLGMTPVVCADVPGFVVNRVQMALLNEAIELVQRRVASAEDVDNAVRMALGMRLAVFGPLKLNDLFSRKRSTLATMRYIYAKTGHPKFRPPTLLRRMVEAGEDGLLSGKGFFSYGSAPLGTLLKRRDRAVIAIVKALRQLSGRGLPDV